jgi:hypothetical protein
MEEAAHLGSEPKKSTFEVRGPGSRSPRNFPPTHRQNDTLTCIAYKFINHQLSRTRCAVRKKLHTRTARRH